MNALPTTGELFAANQVSPETERCYKYQLRSCSAHCVAVESSRPWSMVVADPIHLPIQGSPFRRKLGVILLRQDCRLIALWYAVR